MRKIDQKHGRGILAIAHRLCHQDRERRAFEARRERLAPVHDPVVAVLPRHRHHHRGIGPRAALFRRFRHQEAGAAVPRDQRVKETRFLLVRCDMAQKVDIALIRRECVQSDGAER